MEPMSNEVVEMGALNLKALKNLNIWDQLATQTWR